MKEQALLKEEMAYQYKLGNFEVRIILPFHETLIDHTLLFFQSLIVFSDVLIGCSCYSKTFGPRYSYVDEVLQNFVLGCLRLLVLLSILLSKYDCRFFSKSALLSY